MVLCPYCNKELEVVEELFDSWTIRRVRGAWHYHTATKEHEFTSGFCQACGKFVHVTGEEGLPPKEV